MDIHPLNEPVLPDECFVFKHSTACPISARAASEVRGAELALPLYWINVIEQRPLSDWVSRQYGIKHESPQLLMISGAKVVQSWSHGDIRRTHLERVTK